MSVQEMIQGFVAQSQRVITVTHKPQPQEFKHIAFSTALGITVIGVLGFIISMAAILLRG